MRGSAASRAELSHLSTLRVMTEWPSLSQPTASRMVAHRLRLAIRAGEYAEGERLPSQRALASDFGVAQNTAREAIKILAAEGLVVAHHGKGVFVAAPFQTSTTSPEGFFTGTDLHPSEEPQAAKYADTPAYAMAGQLFLCLRTTLEDATWVDTWRVTATKIVLEWDRGPSVDEVVAQVLPREAEVGSAAFANGVPGLRVVRRSDDDAQLTWLTIPGSHALLRRYEQ